MNLTKNPYYRVIKISSKRWMLKKGANADFYEIKLDNDSNLEMDLFFEKYGTKIKNYDENSEQFNLETHKLIKYLIDINYFNKEMNIEYEIYLNQEKAMNFDNDKLNCFLFTNLDYPSMNEINSQCIGKSSYVIGYVEGNEFNIVPYIKGNVNCGCFNCHLILKKASIKNLDEYNVYRSQSISNEKYNETDIKFIKSFFEKYISILVQKSEANIVKINLDDMSISNVSSFKFPRCISCYESDKLKHPFL